MPHVFISYARPDLAWADLVQARLQTGGVIAWMDRSALVGGEEWLDEIDSALGSATAVVVILSPSASKSHYVTYEWAFAMGKGIRVIPLLFKKASDWPQPIRQLQSLDFTNASSYPWERLVALVKPVSAVVTPTVPDPPKDFRHFVLGNIELPVMPVTGSPGTPFTMKEVEIEYRPVVQHEKPDYPKELLSAKPYLREEYRRRYEYTHDSSPRNLFIRIADWKQEGETQDNDRGGLRLILEITSFDTYITTNRSLDYGVVPQNHGDGRSSSKTIRQAYVKFPYELKHSVLSNPLAVMTAVISRSREQDPQDQIIIQYRGDKVASYRNRFQVSAAGYMSMAHKDQFHNPNPFVTAVSEATEEIGDCLGSLSPNAFKLIGLAYSWVDMLPLAYGFIEMTKPVRELIGDFARDGYEGIPSALPFTPEAVLGHLSAHQWTPDGAFAMCAALLAFFSRERVETAAKAASPKSMRDFFE